MVNKLRPNGENLFYQQYPYGYVGKFTFAYNIDDQGKLKYIDIYYNHDRGGYLNVTDPRFKNNPNLTKYLYDSSYPRIWRSGGAIVDLPRGKKHKLGYPINGVDFYYDEFATEPVLD